ATTPLCGPSRASIL
nr:Chain C, Abz-ALA-THR-THR-PRO-LEU-CYS-GLY-PRO-SER-ARG-ALA-SER-ILE-LEU-SER-GLY [Thermomonospora curvata DSM 43183]6XTO_C Chain C, ABZ-ALA-THR-THR-PRO-LEU-CYS-GLY-PRO-SER-ARG-ALA-SER-ILE-LEU-SER-GLY [Thermomonospora curvata DSM 43183]6XTP_C Chain C, ABZ-ALA-THR-THR-PRO-LEU-CYS-GLY-PRO-SER-ARG-ALA-SER-ILE-LEU-SER-GLY [Thermomonospora curvata DSM 43183]6XTQ_C Chain C, ABZ-ALA-THR-THR-PRO-LEU-CYS-GLY-PRO-SER-ARG-ALA-SER-ILE-LEU-SER-GLY [Thermomonospora curvata DSM 43183]6XTS_C Chain C, ABZ-ALA-THR